MLAKKSSKNQITLPKTIIASLDNVDYFDITLQNGRVILDTNTVVSALLFGHGRLNWLRGHWRSDEIVALVPRPTF